ncbi:MAG: desulfoferrodoxin [Thermoplasmatota archaeon]
MTDFMEIYRCNICGNIVEVVHTGRGELICCGEPMELLREKTKEDEGEEKHVPVIEKTDQGIKVKVGDTPHPMVEDHYIEWIEIRRGDEWDRIFLTAGETPEAVFSGKAKDVKARIYCNVHGLWTNE